MSEVRTIDLRNFSIELLGFDPDGVKSGAKKAAELTDVLDHIIGCLRGLNIEISYTRITLLYSSAYLGTWHTGKPVESKKEVRIGLSTEAAKIFLDPKVQKALMYGNYSRTVFCLDVNRVLYVEADEIHTTG